MDQEDQKTTGGELEVPRRILYMEDNEALGELFKMNLEKERYVVDIALNGKDGLLALEKNSYDLVIVDHKMPIHDGLDVIRILKSRGIMSPIIMVTGTTDENVAVEAMKLGVIEYVVKDTMGMYLRQFPTLIKKVLNKHQLMLEKQRIDKTTEE